MAELSRRIELVILIGNDGSEVVSERRSDGLIEVVTTSSLEAAQTWVEAHYEGVEWHKARLAIGLIGRLGGDERTATTRGCPEHPAHRPIEGL